MENKLVLYMHAGSGNHGCEAIVNSLCHMIKEETVLVSFRGAEDEIYSLRGLCEIRQERSFSQNKGAHILYYIYRKLTKDGESFIRYRYHKIFQGKMAPLAISIGGDNYCYDSMLNDLKLANSAFNKKGTKTLLLGCSIEPELLEKERIVEDLSKYHTIIARESITYEALNGVFNKASNMTGSAMPRIYCYPDPAFTLGKKERPLPEGFVEGNTVGINVSPLIQSNESSKGITMDNYQELIRFIIERTDMQIALIPHVVWEQNDDRRPIHELYEIFKESGRIVKIEDGSCEELKDCISRCRFFVGARTHATIAAYSSCVPTLAAGYSVKARGIAKDLFGTFEHYVMPVQNLTKPEDLTKGFIWLSEQEDTIRKHLCKIMPDYQSRALLAGKEVDRLWEELSQQPGI